MKSNQPLNIEPPLYEATPKELPRPTYFPFLMAMATTFIFWGIVTSYWISTVGVLLLAIALRGWIFDLLAENTENEK